MNVGVSVRVLCQHTLFISETGYDNILITFRRAACSLQWSTRKVLVISDIAGSGASWLTCPDERDDQRA